MHYNIFNMAVKYIKLLGRVKGIESLLNYQRRSLLSQGYVLTNHFKTNKKYGFQVAHYRFLHVASIIIVIVIIIIIIITIIIIIIIII